MIDVAKEETHATAQGQTNRYLFLRIRTTEEGDCVTAQPQQAARRATMGRPSKAVRLGRIDSLGHIID